MNANNGKSKGWQCNGFGDTHKISYGILMIIVTKLFIGAYYLRGISI